MGQVQKRSVSIGDAFGLWTVIGGKEKTPHDAVYLCRCHCGKERRVTYSGLTSGKSRSCGCQISVAAQKKARHGDSPRHKESLYPTWQGMKTRCTNPNVECYQHYGGRGITVCQEWLDSYEAFKQWASENGWQPGLELYRRNNDGPYAPDNCRWVTHAVNMTNSSRALRITAWGETKAVAEWIRDPRCVVSPICLRYRLRKQIDPEIAMSQPARLA